jgi:hypothetical protein
VEQGLVPLHLHLLRGGDKLGGRLAYVHHWRLLI